MHKVQKDPKGVITERFTQESSGFRWRRKIEQKRRMGNQTPGTGKKFGSATWFDRYCATKSRAYRHRNYHLFLERKPYKAYGR
jgi:hypothetical protein